MPLEQLANDLVFLAAYTNNGQGATGLTVTADVYRGTTKIVTGVSAVEVGDGLYAYTLAAASVTVEGLYACVFKTAGTVDVAHLFAVWCVQKAGVEYLDAAVSSRAPIGGSVTVLNAVAQNGDVTLVQGHDYSGAFALKWTLTNPPAPDPTSVTFICSQLGLSKAVAYSAPRATLEFSALETAAMSRGAYKFEVEAVVSGLTVGLVDGKLIVERNA